MKSPAKLLTTLILLSAALLLLSACESSSNTGVDGTPTAATPEETPSTAPSAVQPTGIPSPTMTEPPTPSPTPTQEPTSTSRPTATATLVPTATSEYPQLVVKMQANCRYGPGKAYLYAHGMYDGDIGEVHGRNYSGTWLWIKPWNLDWHCWAAASVMDVVGDVMALNVVQTRLPHSTLYGPPEEVEAVRNGDLVVVRWSPVWMTEDDYRGYLIEANVCQNGAFFPIAVHVDGTKAEIRDEKGCSGTSGGILYTVEKHGYTDPVDIPWP